MTILSVYTCFGCLLDTHTITTVDMCAARNKGAPPCVDMCAHHQNPRADHPVVKTKSS